MVYGLVPAIAALISAQNGNAQTDNRIWTEEQVIRQALTSNNDVLKASAQYQRQKGAVQVSRSSLLPRISLVADASERQDRLIDRTDDQIDFGTDPRTIQATSGYSSSVEIQQTLYNGSQNKLNHQSEKLKAAAAKATLRDTQLRIVALSKQAFDALLAETELVKNRQDSIKTFERLLSIAQKRQQAGDVAELETLRIEVELSKAHASLAEAQNKLVTAEERLRRLLNLPNSADGLSTKLQFAGALSTADTNNLESIGSIDVLENRYDLLSSKLNWDAAGKTLKAAKRSRLSPTIEANANYDYRSSFYNEDNLVQGWRGVLVGRFDLLDSGRKAGLIQVRAADETNARLTYEELKISITSQINELASQLRNAKVALQSRVLSVNLSEKALAQAEIQYSVGQIALEAVLSAEESLRLARIDYTVGVFNHNSIAAQLEYALGLFPIEEIANDSEAAYAE